jgi:ATP-dependent DNA helicase PIF1
MQLHRTSSYFHSYGAEYRRFQLPIINAFALTIHKVQGLSLPSITIALNRNIFSDGQAYVALSRGKDLEKVFLTHLDFEAIKADPEAIAEYQRLEAKAEELWYTRHY